MINIITEKLKEVLPSGSGIDCDYEFKLLKNSKLLIKNSFHQMTEHGFYSGYVDFQIVFNLLDNDWKLQFINRKQCVNANFGLKDYLEDTYAHYFYENNLN